MSAAFCQLLAPEHTDRFVGFAIVVGVARSANLTRLRPPQPTVVPEEAVRGWARRSEGGFLFVIAVTVLIAQSVNLPIVRDTDEERAVGCDFHESRRLYSGLRDGEFVTRANANPLGHGEIGSGVQRDAQGQGD